MGTIEITDERIDKLIANVNNCSGFDYATKNMLLEILYRWKDGDFSQIVEDHNFIWERLGGTVGKAVKPK